MAGHIAAGYWIDKGKENEVLNQSRFLGFSEQDRLEAGAADEYRKNNPDKAEDLNKPGTFEKLMGFSQGMTKRG